MTGEIHVWMPMIGFDREQPDKGVGELLERTSFIPTGVAAFLFHPDIVNQHPGMSTERTLPPDNCSYYGSPRNPERCRQDWTNYDLKILLEHLAAAGVESYLGIMGVDLGNRWHEEWLSDHPEIAFASRDFEGSYNVLKRLADGRPYRLKRAGPGRCGLPDAQHRSHGIAPATSRSPRPIPPVYGSGALDRGICAGG